MFEFKAIDHINMYVNNLDETIKFYNEVFGFEVLEEGRGFSSNIPFAIIGKSNKGMLAIYEDPDKVKLNQGINHIGFNIKFTNNILQKIKEFGLKIIYYNESGLVEYKNSRSIYIEDNTGYKIELSDKFGGGL
ncbi:MAG: VOC family protein [Bacteriovoracaceae bacterium]|jgi:catechol 2,3-dioxygenase-like lactoylglutathione lyase family enzyme|nr:VOC family protein [Bacteriovoracaceae bacterium]